MWFVGTRHTTKVSSGIHLNLPNYKWVLTGTTRGLLAVTSRHSFLPHLVGMFSTLSWCFLGDSAASSTYGCPWKHDNRHSSSLMSQFHLLTQEHPPPPLYTHMHTHTTAVAETMGNMGQTSFINDRTLASISYTVIYMVRAGLGLV